MLSRLTLPLGMFLDNMFLYGFFLLYFFPFL